jgi:microcystin-dependent protein
MTFAMASAPTGWLAADGTAVSRTTYAALFAAIGTTYGSGDLTSTFNLPDLRGEFVRGLDSSRGVDAGRVIGSFQADELKSHTHTFRGHGATLINGANTASGTNTQNYTINTNATGGTETRPRNIALLYCIKF